MTNPIPTVSFNLTQADLFGDWATKAKELEGGRATGLGIVGIMGRSATDDQIRAIVLKLKERINTMRDAIAARAPTTKASMSPDVKDAIAASLAHLIFDRPPPSDSLQRRREDAFMGQEVAALSNDFVGVLGETM